MTKESGAERKMQPAGRSKWRRKEEMTQPRPKPGWDSRSPSVRQLCSWMPTTGNGPEFGRILANICRDNPVILKYWWEYFIGDKQNVFSQIQTLLSCPSLMAIASSLEGQLTSRADSFSTFRLRTRALPGSGRMNIGTGSG